MGRARELITRELGEMQERVESIRKNANKVVERRSAQYRYGRQLRRKVRRGLTERDEEYLSEVIAQCQKILPTLESLAEASGAGIASFEDLTVQTDELGALAERTLNDRYWELP